MKEQLYFEGVIMLIIATRNRAIKDQIDGYKKKDEKDGAWMSWKKSAMCAIYQQFLFLAKEKSYRNNEQSEIPSINLERKRNGG